MTTATEPGPQPSVFLDRKTQASDSSIEKLERQIAALDARVEDALSTLTETADSKPAKPDETMIWGVPFSFLTLRQTLHHVDQLIDHGEPGYFITANLNYNMLTHRHPELRTVNQNASFIVCDGMPMVWYSKFTGRPLPERVAGSELIYALTKWAAIKKHRVFFLGGAPGVAQAAADKLSQRYPGLCVAGVESPPFRPLSETEMGELIERIRQSEPDIVYVALGQPKGELWIAENFDRIGAPIQVQIGASFDFVAGGVRRAPVWIQKSGMEWFYRLAQGPRRLAGRYWKNGTFLLGALIRDALKRNKS